MLAEREGELRELRAKIAALWTWKLEKEARARLKDLKGLLRSNPVEARRAIDALLTGPLFFKPINTPDGHRFQVTGEGRASPGEGCRARDQACPRGMRSSPSPCLAAPSRTRRPWTFPPLMSRGGRSVELDRLADEDLLRGV